MICLSCSGLGVWWLGWAPEESNPCGICGGSGDVPASSEHPAGDSGLDEGDATSEPPAGGAR